MNALTHPQIQLAPGGEVYPSSSGLPHSSDGAKNYRCVADPMNVN